MPQSRQPKNGDRLLAGRRVVQRVIVFLSQGCRSAREKEEGTPEPGGEDAACWSTYVRL